MVELQYVDDRACWVGTYNQIGVRVDSVNFTGLPPESVFHLYMNALTLGFKYNVAMTYDGDRFELGRHDLDQQIFIISSSRQLSYAELFEIVLHLTS